MQKRKDDIIQNITSPIITACVGSVSSKAALKNPMVGLPTTFAFTLLAYSSPLMNGPGPRASPSGRL